MFARVIERAPGGWQKRRWVVVLLLLGIVAATAAYLLWRPSSEQPRRPSSIRVVHDRPGVTRVGAGATISEAEAILRLRRSLDLPSNCVAIISHGFHEGAYDFGAVNSCDHTKLGRWRVDGRSGGVSRP